MTGRRKGFKMCIRDSLKGCVVQEDFPARDGKHFPGGGREAARAAVRDEDDEAAFARFQNEVQRFLFLNRVCLLYTSRPVFVVENFLEGAGRQGIVRRDGEA